MKISKLIVFFLMFLFLGSCVGKAKKDEFTKKDEKIILKMMEEISRAHERKDIKTVMKHWYKRSPDYKRVKKETEKTFEETRDTHIKIKGNPKITYNSKTKEVILEAKSIYKAKQIVLVPFEQIDEIKVILKKTGDEWKLWKVLTSPEKKKDDQKKDKDKKYPTHKHK